MRMREGDIGFFDTWVRNVTEEGSCIQDCWNRIRKAVEARPTVRAKRPVQQAKVSITNSAMDAIAWLERCFGYVPDCTWRDDLRRFIERQRHQ